MEHNYILDILKKHAIISYHRYVDDIIMVYNTQYMNINNTLADFVFIRKSNLVLRVNVTTVSIF
jgi:hypothetical protein